MQITAIIEDAKVESMDSIIEEEIVKDGESETIQSIDVVSFNKLWVCCLQRLMQDVQVDTAMISVARISLS